MTKIEYWTAREHDARESLARWIERGECHMTRGAIGRARDWLVEVGKQIAFWESKALKLAA
jgi:hypothetical protein